MSDKQFGFLTTPFKTALQDIQSYGKQSKPANKGSIFAKTNVTLI